MLLPWKSQGNWDDSICEAIYTHHCCRNLSVGSDGPMLLCPCAVIHDCAPLSPWLLQCPLSDTLSWMTAQGQWGAVMDDCTGTKEQLCGSSPLLEASKGEEPHTCSIVPVQSSMTAPMSHKVTIWLPKEYKRAAWLGSPQLLVDSQHSNISHTFITFYKYVYMCIFSGANSQLIYL